MSRIEEEEREWEMLSLVHDNLLYLYVESVLENSVVFDLIKTNAV